jgi:hypothetical protein
MARQRNGHLLVLVLAVAACDSLPLPEPQSLCALSPAATISLAVGADTSIDPARDGGCVRFPANASTADSAEYLVIAQAAGGAAGATAAFQLRSTGSAALPAAAQPAVLPFAGARGTVAARFDHFLRQVGHRQAGPAPRPVRVARSLASLSASSPPVVGSLRTFRVCAALDCSSFQRVTGRVRAVGGHVAIYVDTLAPAGGLDSADVDTLQQVFDVHGYAVDTTAFGRESDIDSNGVVIALMTNVVNHLVTAAQCQSAGYVAGFFFAPDIDPTSAQDTLSNHGEVIYTVVADPAATLSCAHQRAEVKGVLPSTLLHELQHMINYNQHVLVRRGNAEDDWLDEGLSKYAEELGGWSVGRSAPTFTNYVIGDFYDAYQYLRAPGAHFMVTITDQDLADVGGGWLFVRYLVDQTGAGITPRLVQTPLTGTANVAAQVGIPFPTLASQWALALWVSDLPRFAPPATLRFTTWSFRQTFASLYSQQPRAFPLPFPLVPPAVAGSAVSLSDTLRAGSGFYIRALQGPRGGAFELRFLGPTGAALPAAISPRLDVIRIR